MKGNGEDEPPQRQSFGRAKRLGQFALFLGHRCGPLLALLSMFCKSHRPRMCLQSAPSSLHFVCLLHLLLVTAVLESSRTNFTWMHRERCYLKSAQREQSSLHECEPNEKKRENLQAPKAPLCSVGRLFVSIGRRLTSARSLIEALNLASPRREGNQGRSEQPAGRIGLQPQSKVARGPCPRRQMPLR